MSALWGIKSRPTPGEPANVTFRTSELDVLSPPIVRGSPVNTLSTPAGIPARSASTASANADKGVDSAGLTTMVHPAANAGPAFLVIIAAGKFQGVMAQQTPTGSFTTTNRRSFQGDGIVSP